MGQNAEKFKSLPSETLRRAHCSSAAVGTTARIDALLEDDEYRLDFIRKAIEAEVEKRVAEGAVRKRKATAG